MGNCVVWFSVNSHSVFTTESEVAIQLSRTGPFLSLQSSLPGITGEEVLGRDLNSEGELRVVRRALEGFRLLSAASLVSTAFLCDSQWHPDTLDIWSYGCMCTLCCLSAVELMWLYVCIKFSIIQCEIKPLPPSKSLLREMYFLYVPWREPLGSDKMHHFWLPQNWSYRLFLIPFMRW